MDIKEVITKALHANFSEFTEDQAEAVIEAIKQEGFVLIPKTPDMNAVKKICIDFILGEDMSGNPVGLEPYDAEEIYKIIVKSQEPAND
ncbi:hypothetical protein ABLT40_05160 [Acinetobacter schindleri]|uniref:hypothetical protein n=1 Tax=Acinetobacter schindleri TaxID=108981 RepID=UPI0032B328E1